MEEVEEIEVEMEVDLNTITKFNVMYVVRMAIL